MGGMESGAHSYTVGKRKRRLTFNILEILGMEDGMGQDIDFVVTWVDGSDKEWREEKARYSGHGAIDDNEERYRDWGLFRYWFRGVEQFAPWVRKVHLVTWGHLPDWLNTDNPKLHIVRHEDYIPKEFLPTFNSNVLELYLHDIPGLSEQFVYFNDDVYLIKPVKKEDFFREGKPCDMLALQPVVANPSNPVMSHIYLNNNLVLSKYFDKRENMKAQIGKYFKLGYPPLYFFYNILELTFPLFTGFYTVHGPASFCKETFEELWEMEGELFCELSQERFRSGKDVSQYLFREWQKLKGNFVPLNVKKMFRYYDVKEENGDLARILTEKKKKFICINDGRIQGNADRIQEELTKAFDQLLPKWSSFESVY